MKKRLFQQKLEQALDRQKAQTPDKLIKSNSKKPIPQNVKDKIRYFLIVVLEGWVKLLKDKEQ